MKLCQYYGIFKAQADSHTEGTICYTANYIGELKTAAEITEVIWLNFNNINDISPVDKLILVDLKTKI